MELDLRDGFLRTRFAPDLTADFHYVWLRHNCDCCRHPLTNERTLCSSRVPLDIRPLRAALGATGGALEVVWPQDGGEHRSIYDPEWLLAHAYAINRTDVPPPSSDVAQLEIDAAAPELGAQCLARVAERGAGVMRAFGADSEAIIGLLAARGLRVIETHFGRIEDLRTDNTTNRNTDQLGYTDAPVDLHTDQPFLPHPPRYQALHCMQPAADGGDSYLADAWQAAAYLRSLDAGAYDLLTQVPIRFHRRQRAFQSLVVAPLLTVHGDQVRQVRSSYFTMDPHQVAFDRMEAWYRAYNRFVEIVDDPRHQYRFRLAAGDFLLYDNHRMLHARTGFTGARWLRGIYFDGPLQP